MYEAEKLIKLAKRDNNPNRDYLLINVFQAKHYPADPKDTFKMCETLAEKIQTKYPGESFLVIGFAEAATAIAAMVANFLGCHYIQTTREVIDGVPSLNFSEEHSHAKNQFLYIRDFEKLAQNIDRIVFVEDEITTGKTLQNASNVLRQICKSHLNFSIATLLDCTHDFQKDELSALNIDILSLMELDKDEFGERLKDFRADGKFYDFPICEISEITDDEKKMLLSNVNQLDFRSTHDPKMGADIMEINDDLELLWEALNLCESNLCDKKIRVLGTEEFVYPSLFIGAKLSEYTNEVRCHSTTRSPMLPGAANHYPLKSRALLPSLYEDERITFLYNLEKADYTIVLTDSHYKNSSGMFALLKALKNCKNENIYWIWWKR